MGAFKIIQDAKITRQKQEQDFMKEQMNIQTGSIERMAAEGVDGSIIRDIAKQQTMQRAMDRSDAKVESAAQADAAMANLNTFKEAEERERKHQVDMTGQSAKMMDAAKQNVPDTLVQGGGAEPNVFIPTGRPGGAQGPLMKCPKCGFTLQPNMKFCPSCGEPVASAPLKCTCGATLEPGWKICPFCGKPIGQA
jgi:rubrerythrin